MCFTNNFQKPTISWKTVNFLKFVGEIQQPIQKSSQKNNKVINLPHSKTIKTAKKLSVFGENDSYCLSKFMQTHNFWKLDHISWTYNQINYRNKWCTKVTIILIMMAQVFFFWYFFEKSLHLNDVELQAKFDNDVFLKWLHRLSIEFTGNWKMFWSVSPRDIVLMNVTGLIQICWM